MEGRVQLFITTTGLNSPTAQLKVAERYGKEGRFTTCLEAAIPGRNAPCAQKRHEKSEAWGFPSPTMLKDREKRGLRWTKREHNNQRKRKEERIIGGGSDDAA